MRVETAVLGSDSVAFGIEDSVTGALTSSEVVMEEPGRKEMEIDVWKLKR